MKVSYAVLFLVVLTCASALQSLSAQDCSQDFGLYYAHKKSVFEVLPDTEDEIIFLGDSITDRASWAELLQNPAVKNRGISADVVMGVLCRIDEVVASGPKQIFLMIGTNDLAKNKSPEYVVSTIEKIVQQIQSRSPGTDIYIQSILPVNPDFDVYKSHMKSQQKIIQANNGLVTLAEEYKVTYLNLYKDFVTADGKLKPAYTKDGLHLTGAGYQQWISNIHSYIK